jgi:hypothetical protein
MSQRFERFRDEIAELEVSTPVDAHERASSWVGIGVIAAGLMVIVGGYWGASGTALVAEQMPYLLSGGLFGLGLVIAGAALFVRYSMSRHLRFCLMSEIYEQRAQTERIVEALAGIEELLAADHRRTLAEYADRERISAGEGG